MVENKKVEKLRLTGGINFQNALNVSVTQKNKTTSEPMLQERAI